MSFLDRIAECNRHDPARYVPFRVAGVDVGRLRRDRLDALAGRAELEIVPGAGVSLAPSLADSESRTAALDGIVRDMAARGLCAPRRGEPFPVGVRFGESLCEVDRAGAEFFGIAACGVHLNGHVDEGADMALWVPTRSRGVRVCPGQFDNMVAGGQPARIGIVENLVKESAEEAGLPAALARRAAPAGTVTYALDGATGLKRGVLFVFDLALPRDFTPVNRDGEVEDFALWPVAKAMRRVAETGDFKFDSALVLIDFFIRRGFIPPDHPDYVAICAGLRRGACAQPPLEGVGA